MHYCRLYNHGSLDGGQRNAARGVHETSEGYLATIDVDHPAAGKGGHVYLHRKIFYDLRGPGPHRCHWCSKWVTWKKLKVDHKDTNRKNNVPDNLVAACQVCNLNRDDCAKINRTKSPTITFDGQTHTVAFWAQKVGIKVQHFYWRLEHWSLERALTVPARKHALRKPRQLCLMDELFDASANLVKRAEAKMARSARYEARANRMKS
ncbi:HNH endonuclease [Bradyrhizobium barranii subsp. apii]|nr:HNH endonuclease signature motif containing protein [Bradyrhizobium barranii]UPT99347.1 HNH endonuclease [Bradyrhizobium barranii subsp. apii]